MDPTPTVLVLGFGPFLDVRDNPAAALARALDGREIGGLRLVGRVMPVSYRRAPAETLAGIAELAPVAVLGIGVAVGRVAAQVERWSARVVTSAHADVDGEVLLPEGPERVATHDPEGLAAAVGVTVSESAGAYVCNAWIHAVVPRAGRRTAFLHVPEAGFDADQLAAGLARWARG